MKSKLIIGLIVLLAAGAGLWLYFDGGGTEFNIEGTRDKSEEKISKQHKVLDCSGENDCFMNTIESRYTFNPDPGIGTGCSQDEYNPADPQECGEQTQEGLEEIGMIADPANYINLPLNTERNYNDTRLGVQLTHPWDLEFLPNGKVVVTERLGAIKLIDSSFDSVKTLKDVNPVHIGETGLLGLAVDPNFNENGYIYTYHTYKVSREAPTIKDTNVSARVTRWILSDETLTEDKVIIDNIPASGWHAGARLNFGPDGYLYITTGDAEEHLKSQDPNFLGGKVLRVTRNGEPAPDNMDNTRIYSRGYRNPQGIAWASDGTLYVSGHGPKRYDEINKVEEVGQNDGWGVYYCDRTGEHRWGEREPLSETSFPEICYDYYAFAPSGMTIVTDPSSPWYDTMLIAGLRGRHIHRVPMRGSNITGEGDIFFATDEGHRLRDVEYHKGSLYILGDQKGVWKLTPQ